jgi:hypothetical protein
MQNMLQGCASGPEDMRQLWIDIQFNKSKQEDILLY